MSQNSDDRLQCVCAPAGFERQPWSDRYYPDNCPPDWRIAYFMNDFPAVYLSAEDWFGQPDLLEVLVEELEPGFELVLQWPAGITLQRLEEMCKILAPLRGYIACMVLDATGVAEPQLEACMKRLVAEYSLNLSCSSSQQNQLQVLAERYGVNFVWHGEALKLGNGRYQVVSLATLSLREYTPILKRLQAQMNAEQRAAVFLEPAPETAQRALELRTVIELMAMA